MSRAGPPGGGSVRRIALADLRRLAAAARAAGIPLAANSAYRSEALQGVVFARWVRASGAVAARRASARAGHSEHQLGTTIDLSTGGAAPWTIGVGRDRAAAVKASGLTLRQWLWRYWGAEDSGPDEDGTNRRHRFPIGRNRRMMPAHARHAMQRDLVERARGGDRDAFATLATGSIGRLFNLAQLMLRDRDLADDAVQEALVLAWRDLKGLRDLDGFDAWLRRVLVRCVYREANRERRRSSRTVQVLEIPSYPDSLRDVENRDALDRGFRRIRPEHRAVLVLHHYFGFSDDEAADALSVPAGTIKSRLNRATSALRAELEADARSVGQLAVEIVQ